MQNIKLTGVSRDFRGKQVLSNLDMEFTQGTITIITGPSGCGKTTLLNTISGLDSQYSGNIGGVPEKIAYMFQENRLLPWMSLLENIEFVTPPGKGGEISEVLDMLELSPHKNKRASQLSGGMARRCALARALCYDAPLLLLDEPFNGLDRELKLQISEKLKVYFNKKDTTVIMVSHDLEAAQTLGGEIVELNCSGNI